MRYSQADLSAQARFARAAAFLGLTDRDLQLIRQTAGRIRSAAPVIVDGLYERLASFSDSERLLAQAEVVTGETIDRRREALTAWLGNVLTLVAEGSPVLPDALCSTGAVHAGAGKSGVEVPLDLMVMTTASLQNAINSQLLAAEEAEGETLAAWGKLLWLVFDMMASAYDELPDAAGKP